MTLFLFEQGVWLGDGQLFFPGITKGVGFVMKWEVQAEKEGVILASHRVELDGTEDILTNSYKLTLLDKDAFSVEMENSIVGLSKGRGFLKEDRVGWEIAGSEGFTGYELYCLQQDGSYQTQAEYTSQKDHRSRIEGRLWKKLG